MQPSKRSREVNQDHDGDSTPLQKKGSVVPVAEDHPLLQLFEKRWSEVHLLLEHITKLKDHLIVARRELEESSTLLKQLGGKLAEEVRGGAASRVNSGSLVNYSDLGARVEAVGSASRASSGSTMAGSHPLQMSARLLPSSELISRIKTTRKPSLVRFHPSVYVDSQRKRKPRCLELNPAGENQCATSGLDGILSFWRIEGQGQSLSLQHTVDCLSPDQRRWPEDLDWHPSGESLVACYTADYGCSQVSIIKNSERKRATFLPNKPHEKGIINSIKFLPWSKGRMFITGGCDHAVVLWSQGEDKSWQVKVLHRSLHTSAVVSAAGIVHRNWVLSAGCDKRVIAYDPKSQQAVLTHQLDTRAITVVPNPVDHNLFMVHTGTLGMQLRLFDIRAARTQLHHLGWSQEATESQSGLISSSWSPDGLFTVSGSVDPKIHIFDIRYAGSDPATTIKAHTKRVFKAAWHHTLPLLTSISSDLQIGLHTVWK